MAVYQDKAKERIKSSFTKSRRIAQKAVDEKYSEADTRKLVIDVLVFALGWDRFEDVTAEQMRAGGIADYVVMREGIDLFVVEVKKINLKLNQSHVDQAKAYAVEQGMEWAVVTNGDVWQVYRIVFSGRNIKTPEAVHVFTVSLLDDMKPSEKAELFYLLSKEAFRKDELHDFYNKRIALCGVNLSKHILSEDVLNRIRLTIKKETDQNPTNAEIADAIISDVFSREIVCEEHFKMVRKVQSKKTN
jgi:predicted type IV restriction endonuclease